MRREAGIKSSSPPLSKPHLPQNSEVQPFPLPVLPCPDIPVGGRLAHFVEQWEELTDNKWVLSIVRNGFEIPFKSVHPLSVVPINLSLPVIARRNRGASQETGSGNGSESMNFRFLFPAIPSTKKEWKVLAKSLYTQTKFQNGDSQVGKTVDNVQRLGCLHKSDGCISSPSDTSNFQEVPAVRLLPPGISIHGLTVWNVPKSVGLYKANECHSNTFMSTCHISLSIPRRLADKRSDSQSPYLSTMLISFCPEQDTPISVQNSSDSPSLATTSLVLRGHTTTCLSSSSSSSCSKFINSSKRKVSASKPPSSQPSHLGVIKQSEIKKFRKTLRILSPDQDEHQLRKSMTRNGSFIPVGVIEGRSRPLLLW